MSGARTTTEIDAGGEVTLLRETEIAPGSLLHLYPGDVGRVVKVTEAECTARISGATVVVPLDWVRPTSA